MKWFITFNIEFYEFIKNNRKVATARSKLTAKSTNQKMKLT